MAFVKIMNYGKGKRSDKGQNLTIKITSQGGFLISKDAGAALGKAEFISWHIDEFEKRALILAEESGQDQCNFRLNPKLNSFKTTCHEMAKRIYKANGITEEQQKTINFVFIAKAVEYKGRKGLVFDYTKIADTEDRITRTKAVQIDLDEIWKGIQL